MSKTRGCIFRMANNQQQWFSRNGPQGVIWKADDANFYINNKNCPNEKKMCPGHCQQILKKTNEYVKQNKLTLKNIQPIYFLFETK